MSVGGRRERKRGIERERESERETWSQALSHHFIPQGSLKIAWASSLEGAAG